MFPKLILYSVLMTSQGFRYKPETGEEGERDSLKIRVGGGNLLLTDVVNSAHSPVGSISYFSVLMFLRCALYHSILNHKALFRVGGSVLGAHYNQGKVREISSHRFFLPLVLHTVVHVFSPMCSYAIFCPEMVKSDHQFWKEGNWHTGKWTAFILSYGNPGYHPEG